MMLYIPLANHGCQPWSKASMWSMLRRVAGSKTLEGCGVPKPETRNTDGWIYQGMGSRPTKQKVQKQQLDIYRMLDGSKHVETSFFFKYHLNEGRWRSKPTSWFIWFIWFDVYQHIRLTWPIFVYQESFVYGIVDWINPYQSLLGIGNRSGGW
jgi:hypothetical protein